MTRVTRELPESAARKLAALTPEQRSELSALLGYEVRSITVQPVACMNSQRKMHEVMGKPESEPVGHLEAIVRNQKMLRIFTAKYPHCWLTFDELFSGVAQTKLGEFFRMTPRQVSKMRNCVQPDLYHFRAKGATA